MQLKFNMLTLYWKQYQEDHPDATLKDMAQACDLPYFKFREYVTLPVMDSVSLSVLYVICNQFGIPSNEAFKDVQFDIPPMVQMT